MNRKEREALLRQQLEAGLAQLGQSLELLDYSRRKCARMGRRARLTPAQLESHEAFCARFARTADILVQKVFSTIFLLLKEPEPSLLDRVHRAEKLGLIAEAGLVLEVRDVRNQIAHEYAGDALRQLFRDVALLTPGLLAAARRTAAFARRRLLPAPAA